MADLRRDAGQINTGMLRPIAPPQGNDQIGQAIGGLANLTATYLQVREENQFKEEVSGYVSAINTIEDEDVSADDPLFKEFMAEAEGLDERVAQKLVSKQVRDAKIATKRRELIAQYPSRASTIDTYTNVFLGREIGKAEESIEQLQLQQVQRQQNIAEELSLKSGVRFYNNDGSLDVEKTIERNLSLIRQNEELAKERQRLADSRDQQRLNLSIQSANRAERAQQLAERKMAYDLRQEAMEKQRAGLVDNYTFNMIGSTLANLKQSVGKALQSGDPQAAVDIDLIKNKDRSVLIANLRQQGASSGEIADALKFYDASIPYKSGDALSQIDRQLEIKLNQEATGALGGGVQSAKVAAAQETLLQKGYTNTGMLGPDTAVAFDEGQKINLAALPTSQQDGAVLFSQKAIKTPRDSSALSTALDTYRQALLSQNPNSSEATKAVGFIDKTLDDAWFNKYEQSLTPENKGNLVAMLEHTMKFQAYRGEKEKVKPKIGSYNPYAIPDPRDSSAVEAGTKENLTRTYNKWVRLTGASDVSLNALLKNLDAPDSIVSLFPEDDSGE